MEYDVIDGFRCRPGTTDRYAVAETRRIFKRPGAPGEGDVCLDLGAHIGSFTGRALAAGARSVVAVEPEPGNCAMFRLNVADPRASLVEAAVAGENGEIPLYLGSTYGHTTVRPRRSRKTLLVPTVSIDELMADCLPTFVKIDVEGAEYDLGLPWSLPSTVDRVFIEFHLTFGNRDKGIALRQEFLDGGWSPLWESGAADRPNMEGLFVRTR